MARANPVVLVSALAALAALVACGGDSDGGDSPGSPDASLDLTPKMAVIGQRCAPTDRVGLVTINDYQAYAYMFNTVDPQEGEPELSDEHCNFHRYAPSQSCSCSFGELCSIDDGCVPAPVRATDGVLTIKAGDQTQTFVADEETGELYGELSLPGDTFAIEISAFGQVVTTEDIQLPGEIPELAASLTGNSEFPEAIDATWQPMDDGGTLFTNIPINHHAGGRTYTECAVDTSVGSLHIDGEMLEPLAVGHGTRIPEVRAHSVRGRGDVPRLRRDPLPETSLGRLRLASTPKATATTSRSCGEC